MPATATTTVSTRPAAPTTTSVIGLALSGQGSTLTPPSAPTTKPYSADCKTLFDKDWEGDCLFITSESGAIAALVEWVEPTYNSTGQGTGPTPERDLVYRHVGSTWNLALRRTESVTSYAELWRSDVNRDSDPKAVFVVPAPNTQFGEELDVVDASGQVTLQRQLQGGFATIATGGGLETFVPDSSGYTQTVIRYTSGAWRIASVAQQSQSQAEPQGGTQPFTDPSGTRAN